MICHLQSGGLEKLVKSKFQSKPRGLKPGNSIIKHQPASSFKEPGALMSQDRRKSVSQLKKTESKLNVSLS